MSLLSSRALHMRKPFPDSRTCQSIKLWRMREAASPHTTAISSVKLKRKKKKRQGNARQRVTLIRKAEQADVRGIVLGQLMSIWKAHLLRKLLQRLLLDPAERRVAMLLRARGLRAGTGARTEIEMTEGASVVTVSVITMIATEARRVTATEIVDTPARIAIRIGTMTETAEMIAMMTAEALAAASETKMTEIMSGTGEVTGVMTRIDLAKMGMTVNMIERRSERTVTVIAEAADGMRMMYLHRKRSPAVAEMMRPN